jgi:hypothetical protein
MANEEHLIILNQGVTAWNKWRHDHPDLFPDLRFVRLNRLILAEANLSRTNLSGSSLDNVNFAKADLHGTKFNGCSLNGANFSNANLFESSFRNTNLSEAIFIKANINSTFFSNTNLNAADLSNAHLTNAIFNRIDLSVIHGLDRIKHFGPSLIDIDSLYKSGGIIPDIFLRGCGIPDEFIAFIPSFFGKHKSNQFYSCFISYSAKDENFAERLHSRMQDEHLLVWFAPEDIRGGQKIHEQIERAIQTHDRLLLVLSENSMQSEWVMTEIRNARRVELNEKRRKIFPIRLVDFDQIKKWKCFDSETGKDLAVEVREYFIPDFTHWKKKEAFELAFDRLLHDLASEELK